MSLMQTEKTLRQHFDEFLKECQYSSRLRPETVRGYAVTFTLFQAIMPEVTTVKSLTTEMLNEFFRRLHTRERKVGKDVYRSGIKNSTLRTYWSKLNTFLKWLQSRGIITKNPISTIKPPEAVYEDDRALRDEDIRKLYAAIALHSKSQLILRRDTAMLSTLLFCGVRFNEFTSIAVQDIDSEKRLLTIRGQTSKSKNTRYIPMHPTLAFHLKDYLIERNRRGYKTHLLFVSARQDRGIGRDGVKHWVKRLNQKSGVQFHLHRFRHTFASNLARKDVNAVKIQKLLGHKNLNMTMTYLRSIHAEELQEEIQRLSI